MIRFLSPRRAAALALLAMLGLGISACVTLFPKVKAVQIYRFDVAAGAAATPADGSGFSVFRSPTTFGHGSDTDRILTVAGDQVAYIADARWIAPAAVLFDEAESHAFDQSSGPAHLGRRGEVLNAPVSLRLDVESFEARYLDGDKAAPTVVVRVRASLNRVADHKVLAVRTFESQKKAADNRIAAIVPGFDAALTEVLGQVVSWTDVEGSKGV